MNPKDDVGANPTDGPAPKLVDPKVGAAKDEARPKPLVDGALCVGDENVGFASTLGADDVENRDPVGAAPGFAVPTAAA
jgi:hypothetical protein